MLRHTLVTAQYKVASEHPLFLSMGHVVCCTTCSSGPVKTKMIFLRKAKEELQNIWFVDILRVYANHLQLICIPLQR